MAKKRRKSLENNSWLDKKQIVPIVLSMIFTLVVVYTSYNLQKPYMEKIEPNLEIFPPVQYNHFNGNNVLTFSAQDFVDNRSVGQRITLCVKNTGKTNTGVVTIFLENNWVWPNVWNFENIESGSSNCSDEFVRSNCYGSNNCTIFSVPNGTNKLNFTVQCVNCESSKRIYSWFLDACIWQQNSAECDTIK